jgi:hemolysin III
MIRLSGVRRTGRQSLIQLPRRFRLKEPFSALSHLIGAGLSLVALVTLLLLAWGRPWHTVSFALYGASLILLYTASTLYHALPLPPHGTLRLQRFDHCTIYLLIAGTYTPVCLIVLRGAWGWGLLGLIYGLAGVGIVTRLLWKRSPSGLRLALYLVMGWAALGALGPLRSALPPVALAWLLAGGLLYTVGTVFYATNRPRWGAGRFTGHDLWHLFVLGGSVCHFQMIYRYVALINP